MKPTPTPVADGPGRTAPGTMSLADTARRLGIARSTIYELARRGDPPFKKGQPGDWIPIHYFGRQRRCKAAEVERFLIGNAQAS